MSDYTSEAKPHCYIPHHLPEVLTRVCSIKKYFEKKNWFGIMLILRSLISWWIVKLSKLLWVLFANVTANRDILYA